MKWLMALLILMAAAPSLAGEEHGSDALAALHSIAPDGFHLIDAKDLGRPFYVYVRLPDGYAESDERYPVIYLLDGGFTYPMLASYYPLLRIDEPAMPEAILVGLSYGGAGFENGNYRSTDFTAASPERDFWGGAPKFQDFLTNEVLPFIAQQYRTDETRRIIYGQSLGGQFLVYSAMTQPDLFWGRIASNPAFHRNLDLFLSIEPAKAQTETHLIVTAAAEEAKIFRTSSQRWIEYWTAQEGLPFALHVIDLPGERHATATPLSFRAGMRVLFPTEDTPD